MSGDVTYRLTTRGRTLKENETEAFAAATAYFGDRSFRLVSSHGDRAAETRTYGGTVLGYEYECTWVFRAI